MYYRQPAEMRWREHAGGEAECGGHRRNQRPHALQAARHVHRRLCPRLGVCRRRRLPQGPHHVNMLKSSTPVAPQPL